MPRQLSCCVAGSVAPIELSIFPELKHVLLVEEDVDIFDVNDVMWAMNTRFQGERDIIAIPEVRCHPLDPSSNPEYTDSFGNQYQHEDGLWLYGGYLR